MKPENELDGVCLEFEQCSECVKMDGCDLDADFMPKLNGTKFECDHLIGSPCQELFYIKSEELPEVIPAIT